MCSHLDAFCSLKIEPSAAGDFKTCPAFLKSQYGFREVESMGKGGPSFSSLSIICEDRYEKGTLIMSGYSEGAYLFKLKPGRPPTPLVTDLSTPDNGKNVNGAKIYREIINIAQYNITKIALSEYRPDHCIKEYDTVTKETRALVGVCGGLIVAGLRKNESALSSNFSLGGPSSIVVLEKTRKMLIVDEIPAFSYKYSHKRIYIHNFANNSLELFLPGIDIVNPLSIIASTNESIVYISHHYAITQVSMADRKAVRLTGRNSIDGSDILATGPFKAAGTQTGSLNHLRWLFEDRLLIAAQEHSLVLIDLKDREVHAACEGKHVWEDH